MTSPHPATGVSIGDPSWPHMDSRANSVHSCWLLSHRKAYSYRLHTFLTITDPNCLFIQTWGRFLLSLIHTNIVKPSQWLTLFSIGRRVRNQLLSVGVLIGEKTISCEILRDTYACSERVCKGGMIRWKDYPTSVCLSKCVAGYIVVNSPHSFKHPLILPRVVGK